MTGYTISVFLLIGVALMGLAVWQYRTSATPADAAIVSGTVVDLRRKRFGGSGIRTVVGAVVEYDDPGSGQRERMEPRSFSKRPPSIGDRVQLAYRQSDGRVRLVDEAQRRRALLVIGGIGAVMAALQFLTWLR